MFFSKQNFSLTKTIVPALALSLLVGCGMFKKDGEEEPEVAKEQSKPGDWVDNTIKENKLMGTWESACKGADFLKGIGAHKKEVYKFDGDIFTHVTRYYVNTHECEGQTTFTVLYEGNFQLKDKNDKLDARNADFQYKKSYITAHGANGVRVLNSVSACGVGEWKENEKTEVTGEGASAQCLIYKTPTDRVDVVQLKDGDLYFGEAHGYNFPKERPSKIDDKNPFAKQ
jgi:hypothetical protein